MIIIDATNLIAGRLGTYVAKQALLGNEIRIINSEKAVIGGKRERVFSEFLRKRHMGTFKGPFITRLPDRLLKRIIRGMLPHKNPRGKAAYGRIICYIGTPDELKEKKTETIPYANVTKLPSLNYVDLKTLSKRLGAKLE